MRIATWNVNSIRARADRVINFLQRAQIDVLALQEIKCKPEQFPYAAFRQAGYEVAAHGLNQWNGVAIASRVGISDVATSFPQQPSWAGSPADPPTLEARALGACVGTADPVRLWSLYVPNGRALDHPHYTYKLQWLQALQQAATQWLEADPQQKLALAGDWNVAPTDQDVWDIDAFQGCTHVSAPERAAFAAFAQAGLQEVTRARAEGYTYWDYQKLRFVRNEGMRIDFIYASSALAQQVVSASIDRDERKGKGASDHAPVIVEIK